MRGDGCVRKRAFWELSISVLATALPATSSTVNSVRHVLTLHGSRMFTGTAQQQRDENAWRGYDNCFRP